MEQTETKIWRNSNKILILILGILGLYLAGNINIQTLLIIAVFTVIIFFVNELALFFLAAITLILWPTVFYFDENWLIFIGNLTYILLFLAAVIAIAKGQMITNIKVEWRKYIVPLAGATLVILIGLTGYKLSRDYYKTDNKQIKEDWSIGVKSQNIDEDLIVTIENLKDKKQFLVVWQKPDGQLFSFKNFLEENNNAITIYKELVDQTGKYWLTVGEGEEMKTKEIEIK
ncbi:MAG: hypothetical protein ACOZAR_02025 [Patescibacteria group bacterium]